MHKLEIIDAVAIQSALRLEIEHMPLLRFVHRLHCLLLVGAGQSSYQVAALFGDNPRSVERWVRKFQLSGIDALRDKPHPGRPPLLADVQVQQLALALKNVPSDFGYEAQAWTSKVLRDEVLRRFGIAMSARNGHRLFKSLSQSNTQESESDLQGRH